MINIKNLVENSTPFAVMQYFEWLSSTKTEKNKVYEILILDKKKDENYKTTILDKDSIHFLKTNLNLFEVAENTKDGIVYEFNNFRQVLKSL